MKKLIFLPIGVLATSMAFGQFFPMDSLIVSRANGTASNAATVDLIGFNYDGTSNSKVFSLEGGTATTHFTVSGSATSDGQMNASAGYIALGGYQEVSGTASVTGTTTQRRAAIFNNTGNGGLGSVTWTDLAAGVYSGNNIRSAYTDDGLTVLTGGTASANAGWRTQTGGTSTQLGTTVNTRVVKNVGGTTFGSTGSATGNAGVGVYSLNGGTETLVQATGTGASPYDFEFYNEGANGYILVADDRTTASGGGLQIWKGGSLVRTFAMPTAAVGLRSLAVRRWINAGNGLNEVTVFGIGNLNSLVAMTFDVGTLETTSNTFSVIATAGANERFKSIEVVPEPASFAILGLGILGLAVRRKRTRA